MRSQRYTKKIHEIEEARFEQVRVEKPPAAPAPEWIPPPEARPVFRLVYGPEKTEEHWLSQIHDTKPSG